MEDEVIDFTDMIDEFVAHLSCGIDPFINSKWPKLNAGELPLAAANVIVNSFINFAAINSAIVGRTLYKLDPELYSSEELLEQCLKLFTQVFNDNIHEVTGVH